MAKSIVASVKSYLTDLLLTAIFSALPLVVLGGIAELLFGLPVLDFGRFVGLALVVGVFDALSNQIFDWVVSPYVIVILLFGLAIGAIELYFDFLSVSASMIFGGGTIFALLAFIVGAFEESSEQVDNVDQFENDQSNHSSNNSSTEEENTITINLSRKSDSASDPFTEKVDPTAVRTTAVDIASDYRAGGSGTFSYSQLAAVHQYVNENITYVPDPNRKNYVAPPEETLETGAGDCDCQAVLIASMFEAIGANTRLVLCESVSGNRHLLAEVCLASTERETQNIANSLSQYYTGQGFGYNSFYYESNSRGYWYPADTAMGRYVGDIFQLSNNGYINGPRSDGSWSWHNVEYYSL